jgi:phage gp29-like protein
MKYPSPTTIDTYLKKADDDKDPRDLMAVLKHMRTINARLQGHISVRKTAVAAYEWQVIPRDGTSTDSYTKAVLRTKNAIKKILSSHHQIPLYGCAAWSLSWEGTQERFPLVVKMWEAQELRTDGLTVSLLKKNEATNFLIGTYIPEDFQNVSLLCESTGDAEEAHGAMRTIFPAELRRHASLVEWRNTNTKYKGLLQGTYDDAATNEEIEIAKAGARDAAMNNLVVTPASIAFKHNQMVSAGASDSFAKMIEECTSEISIGILGQANTSELPSSGGSRAALQVLSQISADYHWSDINRVTEVINRLLLIDYRINVDRGATECPWKFELYLPDTLDLEQRVDAATRLYQSGIPVRTAELYKLLGMTPPDDAPEILSIAAGGV